MCCASWFPGCYLPGPWRPAIGDTPDNPDPGAEKGNKILNEEFDFLRNHSQVFLQMAFGSEKHEKVENPDGYGKKTRGCGDTVEMFITLHRGCIQWVNISLHGCLNTNACANAVAHLGEGRTLKEAWKISPEAVSEFLETLPEF